MFTTINATDVTVKVIFQRLYLIADSAHLCSASTVRGLALPPPLTLWLILGCSEN